MGRGYVRGLERGWHDAAHERHDLLLTLNLVLAETFLDALGDLGVFAVRRNVGDHLGLWKCSWMLDEERSNSQEEQV